MKTLLGRLFCTEAKKYIKAIPSSLLAILLLSALMGLFVFGAVSMHKDEKQLQAKQVGVVVDNPDSSMIQYAFNLLSGMESVEGRLSFLPYSYEDAMASLGKGEIMAVIVVPAEAIEQIMQCADAQISVIFPGEKDLSSIFLTEFTRAGGRLLSAAQAGTQTVTALYKINNMEANDIYDSVDMMNFGYVLPRLEIYKNASKAQKGTINYLSYYLASGILLLFLFAGFGFITALKLDSPQLTILKQSKGISPFLTYFIRIVVSTLAFTLLCTLLLFLAGRFYPLWANQRTAAGFSISVIPFILLLALFLAIYNQCLLYIAGNESRFIILQFTVGTLLSFVSGNILPLAFFPIKFRSVGKYLPAYDLQQNITAFLSGTHDYHYLLLVLWSLIFLVIGLLFVHLRKKQDLY